MPVDDGHAGDRLNAPLDPHGRIDGRRPGQDARRDGLRVFLLRALLGPEELEPFGVGRIGQPDLRLRAPVAEAGQVVGVHELHERRRAGRVTAVDEEVHEPFRACGRADLEHGVEPPFGAAPLDLRHRGLEVARLTRRQDGVGSLRDPGGEAQGPALHPAAFDGGPAGIHQPIEVGGFNEQGNQPPRWPA
ncbi:hypothetical protein V1259_02000 [Zafaria sp. J156]|nr:hypothetical protein [Zafaria sp. J156]MEE1620151.1 hypothetical protein [Zafaria sp. J156]